MYLAGDFASLRPLVVLITLQVDERGLEDFRPAATVAYPRECLHFEQCGIWKVEDEAIDQRSPEGRDRVGVFPGVP